VKNPTRRFDGLSHSLGFLAIGCGLLSIGLLGELAVPASAAGVAVTSQLRETVSAVEANLGKPYSARYDLRGLRPAEGRYEQAGSDALWIISSISGNQAILRRGSQVYQCLDSKVPCRIESARQFGPVSFAAPQALINILLPTHSYARDSIGVRVKYSSIMSGTRIKCFITGRSEVCVTNRGVLAKLFTPDSQMVLVSLVWSAPRRDFAIPFNT